jgi:uncharacterized protein
MIAVCPGWSGKTAPMWHNVNTFVNIILNIRRFITELTAGVTVIIPHLGMLNGGFRAIVESGLWERQNVWADTALASPHEIREYLRRYGHRRLIH